MKFDFGVTQLNFIVGDRSFGGVAIGLGSGKRTRCLGIIEGCQQLILADARAFVTPVTLPVILAAMVARRRGVT
jgi:hypothetical protein